MLIEKVVNNLGLIQALDAHNSIALTHLKRETIPKVDLEIIGIIGIDNSDEYISYIINVARYSQLNQRASEVIQNG